jgi:predicted hotdog family 3-hydroxylacyl-ACP dehydratase
VLIAGNDILQVIPQRPPVVMVDALYVCDEHGAKTGFTIEEDNIFCENGFFSEGGIIENMAQTAAAQIGYLCREKKIPVPIGFIGAVKNLEIFSLPKAGRRLNTTIQIENEVFGVTVISGKVSCDDQLVASAEMKIFIKN